MHLNMSQLRPPSHALNDDVLQEIMLLLAPNELYSAARVYPSWTAPALRTLYRSITFHTWMIESGREALLVDSLRNHQHLRSLVRQISIHSGFEEPALWRITSWLCMFPENSLRNFTYICWPRNTFDASVLHQPAVRTTPHLTAHGPFSRRTLEACFALPNLHTLELDLSEYGAYCQAQSSTYKDGKPEPWKLDASQAPRLRELYIYVNELPCPVLITILTAFAPQLDTLDIHVPPGRNINCISTRNIPMYGRNGSDVTWDTWAPKFVQLACQVRRLGFSGFSTVQKAGGDTRPNQPGAVTPILDDIVGKAASSTLEHLSCIDGLYSRRLFQRLPASVQVLEFYVDAETYSFRHEGALVAMLQGARQRHLGLRTLKLVGPEESKEGLLNVETACKESGIAYAFVSVTTPLHRPPTRPPIRWD